MTATTDESMIDPPIEVLLARAGSKFSLVELAARRARQINSYYNQLGSVIGGHVPPQVTNTTAKPLSIAFEEIAADKIVPVDAPGVDNPDGYVPAPTFDEDDAEFLAAVGEGDAED